MEYPEKMTQEILNTYIEIYNKLRSTSVISVPSWFSRSSFSQDVMMTGSIQLYDLTHERSSTDRPVRRVNIKHSLDSGTSSSGQKYKR